MKRKIVTMSSLMLISFTSLVKAESLPAVNARVSVVCPPIVVLRAGEYSSCDCVKPSLIRPIRPCIMPLESAPSKIQFETIEKNVLDSDLSRESQNLILDYFLEMDKGSEEDVTVKYSTVVSDIQAKAKQSNIEELSKTNLKGLIFQTKSNFKGGSVNVGGERTTTRDPGGDRRESTRVHGEISGTDRNVSVSGRVEHERSTNGGSSTTVSGEVSIGF